MNYTGRCNAFPSTSTICRPRSSVVACWAGSKGPVKVSFRIPYRAHFGQTVGLVGAGALLGQWDGTKAVRLNWSPGDLWVGEIEVKDGPGAVLEYKYVVLNSNGQVSHWKPGRNYQLEVTGQAQLRVSETWDDSGPRVIEVDGESKSNASTSAAQPQPATKEGVEPARQPLSGVAVIQKEALAAMMDLQDALDRQLTTLERVPDPASIEVIMGDRLLAAASSKAVALNRAVRAAQALPTLPPNKS